MANHILYYATLRGLNPKEHFPYTEILWAPKDQEGFTISFEFDQVKQFRSFFYKYGFVIVRDVVDRDQIEATIDELWKTDYLLGNCDRSDPLTWEDDHFWPTAGGAHKRGFLSGRVDVGQQAWNNRQNPKIYELFSRILGPHLWVDPDRAGVMRPTVGIKLKDGTVVNRHHWRTEQSWLHWDQNPWTEPGFHRLQGLLALTDSTETSGGFHCVPGFQKHFDQWSKCNPMPKTLEYPINVPKFDNLRHFVQKITLRAGSFLIWDSRLPHGNYPNWDNTFRIVQYIRMEPCQEDNEEEIKKRYAMTHPSYLEEEPELSDIGKKLLGSYLWHNGEPNELWLFAQGGLF